MPQFYRDARIGAIYEGTNGIQALDLIGRKLPAGGGAAIMGFIGKMKAIDGELAAEGERFNSMRNLLADGVAALEQATGSLARATGIPGPQPGCRRRYPVPEHARHGLGRLLPGQVGADRVTAFGDGRLRQGIPGGQDRYRPVLRRAVAAARNCLAGADHGRQGEPIRHRPGTDVGIKQPAGSRSPGSSGLGAEG